VAANLPPWPKVTHVRSLLWPRRTASFVPDCAFQRVAGLSDDVTRRRSPLGFKATWSDGHSWLASLTTSVPSLVLQTCALDNAWLLGKLCPSPLKATATVPERRAIAICAPDTASQSAGPLASEAVIRRKPSALNKTVWTAPRPWSRWICFPD